MTGTIDAFESAMNTAESLLTILWLFSGAASAAALTSSRSGIAVRSRAPSDSWCGCNPWIAEATAEASRSPLGISQPRLALYGVCYIMLSE